MPRRVCKVPASLVRAVGVALQRSRRFQEGPAKGAQWFVGYFEGNRAHRLELRVDGTMIYPEFEPLFAVVLQAVKGSLGMPRSRFLVGIDEAGVGGEVRTAQLAAVCIGSDARADLIASGVRDSKSVRSIEELGRLAGIIRETALFARVQPLPVPAPGETYAQVAGTQAGALLAELADTSKLPGAAAIRVDNVRRDALVDALGAWRAELEPRLRVEPRSEEHVEVSCASILATQAARLSGKVQRPYSSDPADRAQGPGPKQYEASIFSIGPHRESDKEQIVAFLRSLVHAYPDIGEWIGRDGGDGGVWTKIEAGKHHLTVARHGQEVAGFCITKVKDLRNAKISTFYVAKAYRHRQIGPGILQRELQRLAKAGLRRVMVTFAHEEFFEMQPFLTQHGFVVDGISPQRYRDNSYEVVMGKRFRPGVLRLTEFKDFVMQDLFRMQGYDIEPLSETSFLATPRQDLFALHQLPPGRQFLVEATDSPRPEEALGDLRAAASTRGAHPILAAAYGLPAKDAMPNDVLVFDAYALEALFFPLQIERPHGEDLIIPIRPEFAHRLLPRSSQATLAPSKLALRMENVYYRPYDGRGMGRRGARLFFYESGGRGVFCVAKLKSLAVGDARRLYSKYGGLGALGVPALEDMAKGRPLQAFRFDWTQEFVREVPLEEVKEIHPAFNPISLVRIPSATGDQLSARGTST